MADAGIVTDLTPLLANALLPIFVTFFNVTVERDEQLSNALFPMAALASIVAEVSEMQFINAPFPKYVTLEGIEIDDKATQS